MFIEDFEEVKHRRDQILALTADLKGVFAMKRGA